MHLKTKNIIDQQILTALPANKNKIIIAAVLVVVMLLLWVKFLLRNHGPDTASANTATADNTALTATQTQPPAQSPPRITYVKLPSIPGRHDVITKDIFSLQNWRGFGQKQSTTAQAVQTGTSDPRLVRQNDLKQFAEKTAVDAVSIDTATGRYEAYINNKVISEGSVFQAKVDDRLYRFVVKNISEDKVVLLCEDCTVTLKMNRPEVAEEQ